MNKRGYQRRRRYQTKEQRAEFLLNKQILDGSREEIGYNPRYRVQYEEICNLPYLVDKKTIKFITEHGRMLFVICGQSDPERKMLNLMIRRKYPTSVMCDLASITHQMRDDHDDDSDDEEEDSNGSDDKEDSNGSDDEEEDSNDSNDDKEDCDDNDDVDDNIDEKNCQHRGAHSLIVVDTGNQLELNKYLTLASENGYTVIMAISAQRYVHYTEWIKYGLQYLGWFLCPDDKAFVFQQAKQALANSLGDGKLCRELDVFCEDDIWRYFELESQLFCIASFCNYDQDHSMFHFYLSDTVQQVYGMCFTLSIHGFLISENFVLAVVAITKDMKMLMRSQHSTIKNNASFEEDKDKQEGVSTRSIPKTKKEYFVKLFASAGKTAMFQDYEEGELMNLNHMSFILVARTDKAPDITNVKEFAQQVFSEVANNDGVIERSSFLEFDNGTKYRRLPDKTWFISLPKKIVLSAVFTGLCYFKKHTLFYERKLNPFVRRKYNLIE